jgi:hypothetical protein
MRARQGGMGVCKVVGRVGGEEVEAHRLFCDVDVEPLKISRVFGSAPPCPIAAYKMSINFVEMFANLVFS